MQVHLLVCAQVVSSVFRALGASSPSSSASEQQQQQQQQQQQAAAQGKGVVLVVGATGGVGRRVVVQLKEQGVAVRALVRGLGMQ